jgi:hypothetical protein
MNKTIFILWLQGFDQAPPVVQQCVESWKFHHTHWKIELLDISKVSNYITLEPVFLSSIAKCELANVIRMLLLEKYGGVWVDATVFCTKSLDDWLGSYIQQGFFAFDRPGRDRLLSNWFLYAEQDNYLLQKWCSATLHFHRHNHGKKHPYFIHHDLFRGLYRSDPTFRQLWDRVPKLSADGPHFLLHNGFSMTNPRVRQHIHQRITPMYKLSYYQIPPHVNLDYLFSTLKTISQNK